jgi:hypothetical protein
VVSSTATTATLRRGKSAIALIFLRLRGEGETFQPTTAPATVTIDPDGNTSEFSACMTPPYLPPAIVNLRTQTDCPAGRDRNPGRRFAALMALPDFFIVDQPGMNIEWHKNLQENPSLHRVTPQDFCLRGDSCVQGQEGTIIRLMMAVIVNGRCQTVHPDGSAQRFPVCDAVFGFGGDFVNDEKSPLKGF